MEIHAKIHAKILAFSCLFRHLPLNSRPSRHPTGPHTFCERPMLKPKSARSSDTATESSETFLALSTSCSSEGLETRRLRRFKGV